MDASRDQLDRVDRARLVDSGGTRDDRPSWNLGRAKQGDAIRVDSTSSWCRRQVCKCGCFNHGNVCSREHDDRQGSLEVSAVAEMGNLKKSIVRLRASRTDRVGDRGTPEVEGQVEGSVESPERESALRESVSLQSPLTLCTGNGLTDVGASDSMNNVEKEQRD